MLKLSQENNILILPKHYYTDYIKIMICSEA